ncbi:MAG: OmpA family protein [Alphaproteobacteria bacterium]|nr:OmpA family protein [Alphaproteobacteria bacterium]MBO6862268.1 OmpA family protein [Alphaproteobacteria bacterium]MEC9266098.1 OmpA family protein [Pseudomonadota bacterium]
MRLKVIALLAAATLVAACSTNEEEAVATNDTGSTQAAQPAPPPPPPAPSGPAEGSIEQFMQVAGDRVFFAYDSSELSAQAQSTLDAQASWLAAFPAVTITIEGHADERGTDDYNLALSARRAAAARDYLIARGISAGRIETLPLGESRPVATGSNEASWAQNRRSVTVLTAGYNS